MFPPASITLTSKEKSITLHLFSTGKIAGRLSGQWQPIYVLAIIHPQGIFLVDTGERTQKFHLFYKIAITRDQEAHRQLATLNITTTQINTIILTHRHFDHIDGLKNFPNTPVRYPDPEKLTDTCGPFTRARYLTEAKDLVIVHTPGHTRDHCSVLIRTDTTHILFGGDSSPKHPNIQAYARTHPLTLLLTHDPAASRRLATLEPLLSSTTGTPPQPHP